MRKFVFTFVILFLSLTSQAHYLWIEVDQKGVLDQELEIRVYYGEYTYGVIEKTGEEAYEKVKNFHLWVIAPSGEKIKLKTEAQSNHYSSIYIPTEKGNYTVYLNNDDIEVMDYTEYDFGIFKTHYTAVANFTVGAEDKATASNNANGLTLKAWSTDKDFLKLQIFYKGEPLANAEAKLYVKDLWSKTLTTNEAGLLQTQLPWDEKYILEINRKEEVPGIFKEDAYEFIWHCLTYTIP